MSQQDESKMAKIKNKARLAHEKAEAEKEADEVTVPLFCRAFALSSFCWLDFAGVSTKIALQGLKFLSVESDVLT